MDGVSLLAAILIDGFSRSFNLYVVIDLFVSDLIPTTFIGLFIIYPLRRIFIRVGFAPSLSFLVFVPYFGGLTILGLLAFCRWPSDESNQERV